MFLVGKSAWAGIIFIFLMTGISGPLLTNGGHRSSDRIDQLHLGLFPRHSSRAINFLPFNWPAAPDALP